MELNKQVSEQILTEEELKLLERKFSLSNGYGKAHYPMVEKMVASHRSLNSRNLKLVLENDELMAENMKLKDDYNALVSIIDRARKLAYLAEVEPK